jgi:glutaminase
VGQFQGGVEEKVVTKRNIDKKLKEIRKSAYQVQIKTVILACNAAVEGNLEVMKNLKNLGVDLNLGDYDKRTPLHVAAASGQVKIVLWLIEEANVLNSPVDRWGATPLNDA